MSTHSPLIFIDRTTMPRMDVYPSDAEFTQYRLWNRNEHLRISTYGNSLLVQELLTCLDVELQQFELDQSRRVRSSGFPFMNLTLHPWLQTLRAQEEVEDSDDSGETEDSEDYEDMEDETNPLLPIPPPPPIITVTTIENTNTLENMESDTDSSNEDEYEEMSEDEESSESN